MQIRVTYDGDISVTMKRVHFSRDESRRETLTATSTYNSVDYLNTPAYYPHQTARSVYLMYLRSFCLRLLSMSEKIVALYKKTVGSSGNEKVPSSTLPCNAVCLDPTHCELITFHDIVTQHTLPALLIQKATTLSGLLLLRLITHTPIAMPLLLLGIKHDHPECSFLLLILHWCVDDVLISFSINAIGATKAHDILPHF